MYNANADDIIQSDFLIIVGSFLRYDAPTLGYKVNNALVMNKGAGLYFHPIKDKGVDKYSKISCRLIMILKIMKIFYCLSCKNLLKSFHKILKIH